MSSAYADRLYQVATIFAMVICAGCRATVVDGLSEPQANQVLVTLDSQNISAQKVERARPNGEVIYRIEVAGDELTTALSVLRAAQLPSPPKSGFSDVFSNLGLIPTAAEEKARYAAALSGELERTIEAIDGVIQARVHLALPQSCTLLDGPRPQARASVMVKQRQGAQPVDTALVKTLVAGATTELNASDVAVVAISGPAKKPAMPELVQFGPLTMTRSSLPALKTISAIILILNIMLAFALAVLFAKLRHANALKPLASTAIELTPEGTAPHE
jgi:type III secretion protein J